MCTKYDIDTIRSIIMKYPRLDLNGRVGQTGYIDFITWNEVIYPIMWGTDRYNRLFFVIKGYINNKRIIQTIFQRHEGGSSWNGGGNRYLSDLLGTTGGVSDEQFDFLFELIKNKKAPVNYNIRLNPFIYCLCSTLRYIYTCIEFGL